MSERTGEITITGDGNQYVTFSLGDEEYGVDILKVQEIIGLTAITRVPYLPDFIKGVINLRGIVVPVVDLRLRFGLEMVDYNDRTCVIIVKLGERITGMIVDAVSEVISIPKEMIDPPPSFGTRIRTDFIEGMGKVDKRLLILLNVERLLTEVELKAIEEIPEVLPAEGVGGTG